MQSFRKSGNRSDKKDGMRVSCMALKCILPRSEDFDRIRQRCVHADPAFYRRECLIDYCPRIRGECEKLKAQGKIPADIFDENSGLDLERAKELLSRMRY